MVGRKAAVAVVLLACVWHAGLVSGGGAVAWARRRLLRPQTVRTLASANPSGADHTEEDAWALSYRVLAHMFPGILGDSPRECDAVDAAAYDHEDCAEATKVRCEQ